MERQIPASLVMEPCRFDMGCWRPLCPFGHSGRRAARWAALWSHLAMEEKDQIVDVPEPQIMEDILNEITPRKHIWERILPVPHLQEENVEVIQRSVEGIISQEYISERTQVVDATMPQIMEELQERISERMHEQVVDAPVPVTVHQPGDQACRVPAESIHRQSCRHACGNATTGPSDSDGFEDCGRPAERSSSAELWWRL